MDKRPTLGWRTEDRIIREYHQGGIAARWSDRRLRFLLAEYRLNVRREMAEQFELDLEAPCDESEPCST